LIHDTLSLFSEEARTATAVSWQLDAPATLKPLLTIGYSTLRHSFQSLAIRRLMIDAVASRNRGDRGCHYFAREKSCLFRCEKTFLVDRVVPIVATFVSERIQFAKTGRNIAEFESTRDEKDFSGARFSSAQQALEFKDWQIAISVFEASQEALYDVTMFYTYPLLSFYKSEPSRDTAERATEKLTKLKDGLGLIYQKWFELRLCQTKRWDDFRRLAYKQYLKAINCFQTAISNMSNDKVGVSSTVTLELISFVHIALVKTIHEANSYDDSDEEQEKKLQICKSWDLQIERFSDVLLVTSSQTHNSDLSQTIARCSLLHLLIGLLSKASIYADNLVNRDSVLKPFDTTYGGIYQIVSVWTYINDQLWFIRENISRLPTASSAIQAHAKERLLWFEKTMELIVMYFEATELMDCRLLRYGCHIRRLFDEIFHQNFAKLSSCCRRIDFEPIMDAMDPEETMVFEEDIASHANVIYSVGDIHTLIMSFLRKLGNMINDVEDDALRKVMKIIDTVAVRDYVCQRQGLDDKLVDVANQVHSMLATEFEQHAMAMTENDLKYNKKELPNWIWGPSFIQF
jgi:tetratricopeptide (TPR) repeat protein